MIRNKRAFCTRLAFSALVGLAAATGVSSAEDAAVPFGMRVNHLNLVFSVTDAEATETFYGTILGLKQIADTPLPGNRRMIRFMGGSTELKFIVNDGTLPSVAGGTRAALGIRLAAILLPESERAGIEQRLAEREHEVPEFTEGTSAAGYTFRYGMVFDHDGNQIEVVFLSGDAPEEKFKQVQIGLTVSDASAMDAFLSNVLGLAKVDGPGAPRIHRYAVGESQIKFWEGPEGVPAHVGGPSEITGMSLVQFIVPDVDAVRAAVLERGGTIHTEPFALGTLATIMFVEGPDGILFEFAGPMLDRLR